MKKMFLACLIALMSIGVANAQEQKKEATEAQHGPKIVFAEREHNYGTIQKGGDGNCVFTFTNTGDEPLILSSVRASCGCTTPKWTQSPLCPASPARSVSATTPTTQVDSPRLSPSLPTLSTKPE